MNLLLMIFIIKNLTHPISIILFLLSMMMLSSFKLYFYLKNSWFILIFLLLMLGGLMILFIFMSSISSNLKFNFSTSLTNLTIMSMFFLFFYKYFYMKMHNIMINSSYIFNMFSSNSFFNCTLLMMYLLLGMLLILELSSNMKTPLRSSYYAPPKK